MKIVIAALVLAVAGCGGATGYKPTPVAPGTTATHAPKHTTKPKATIKPTHKVTPTHKATATKPAVVPFKNCQEVFEAGTVPIYPSNPRWNPKLDRDHDGMACEH